MNKKLFILVICGCAETPLHAEAPEGGNNGNFLSLPPTVITAERASGGTFVTPYSVNVVDSMDFSRRGLRTVPEALEQTPGVMVQKTTHGHGSPFIRGFTGRQNLLLVDGVRINNSTWRSGPIQYWNTVDPLALSRLELVKSQGSVLYGSDAIGGTLNAITRGSGFREKQDGWFYGGSATYRFNTNSESHTGRVEQQFGVAGKWGVLLGVSAKDFGDIKDSAFGRIKGTGYPEQNVDFKFEYALSDTSTLTLASQYVNQDDVIRWHSTVLSDPDGDGVSWRHGSHFTTAGDNLDRRYDQERSLTYLRIEETDAAPAWLDSWRATISYQKSQDSQHRVRASGRVDDHLVEVETLGFSLQAQSPLAGGTLLWGADYYDDDSSSAGFRNGVARPQNRPVADDASYETFGIFANYKKNIGERLEMSLGARYTHIQTDWEGYRSDGAVADVPGSNSWDNLSLAMRARYEVCDGWQLHAGVSQAFRAPNLDDLTGTQLALSGLTTKGSPDVEPEEYLTAEIGSRFQSGNFQLALTAYHTWIDDAITRVDDGTGDLVTTNGQDGYVFGAELEAAWQFHPQWKLSGYLAWQDGKIEAPAVLGGPLRSDTIHRLHPMSGGLALTYEPTETLWLQARLSGAETQDNLNSLIADSQRIPANGTPGYLVASLHANWKATENLTLNLTLENLMDEDYRIHGSGVNQPGRSVIVEAKLKF